LIPPSFPCLKTQKRKKENFKNPDERALSNYHNAIRDGKREPG
jgi:hypothetical protein